MGNTRPKATSQAPVELEFTEPRRLSGLHETAAILTNPETGETAWRIGVSVHNPFVFYLFDATNKDGGLRAIANLSPTIQHIIEELPEIQAAFERTMEPEPAGGLVPGPDVEPQADDPQP